MHELCEIFGIESVSYDKEPNRNVVATAHKERVSQIRNLFASLA